MFRMQYQQQTAGVSKLGCMLTKEYVVMVVCNAKSRSDANINTYFRYPSRLQFSSSNPFSHT